jgi:predicted HD phosphohydrolase
MARISPELLDKEYITHVGVNYFLRKKSSDFWDDMNNKYKFTTDEVPESVTTSDHAAMQYIKENYTKTITNKR